MIVGGSTDRRARAHAPHPTYADAVSVSRFWRLVAATSSATAGRPAMAELTITVPRNLWMSSICQTCFLTYPEGACDRD